MIDILAVMRYILPTRINMLPAKINILLAKINILPLMINILPVPPMINISAIISNYLIGNNYYLTYKNNHFFRNNKH